MRENLMYLRKPWFNLPFRHARDDAGEGSLMSSQALGGGGVSSGPLRTCSSLQATLDQQAFLTQMLKGSLPGKETREKNCSCNL